MRNGLIAAFLLLQLTLPLSYYLGDERLDERFAWRMFSPVRTVTCSAALYDESGGRKKKLQLLREVHVAWKRLLERGRRQILAGFARKWCAEAPGRKLTADITCRTPEALSLVVCRSAPANDARPAAFDKDPRCAGESAEACYARECDLRGARDCYASRCRMRPVPVDVDLCAASGGP